MVSGPLCEMWNKKIVTKSKFQCSNPIQQLPLQPIRPKPASRISNQTWQVSKLEVAMISVNNLIKSCKALRMDKRVSNIHKSI